MNVTLPRADIPAVSPGKDGSPLLTRDWYRWASDITARVGGSTGTSSPELEAAAFEDAGIEEMKASVYHLSDDLAQHPAVQELMFVTDQLFTEVTELRDVVAELYKTVNGLRQGTWQ